MFRKALAGFLLLCSAAVPVSAGGGGPVAIQALHGAVQIREIDFHTGRPTSPWRRAQATGLIGSYLLRTGRGSWAHLSLPFSIRERGQWRYVGSGCVDSLSVVRIDSYADSTVRVVSGKITRADGKRSGKLPRVMGLQPGQ